MALARSPPESVRYTPLTESAQKIRSPFFLVGAERSGTTLLRLMLDKHPELAWCSEFEYAVDMMTDSEKWPALEEYRPWLETNRVFQINDFEVDPSLGYPELVNSFLEQKRDRDGKQLVGATVHRHFDRLLRIWPGAKFIHLIRDPRDVARSCIRMGWAGNVWTGIRLWIEAERLWESLKRGLAENDIFEIQYESLITDPQGTLEGLCRFLGIEYDPVMLTYHEDSPYPPPDPRQLQKWRKKMQKREVQLVEARAGQLIAAKGYDLSGYPEIEVTEAEQRRLRRNDRWVRARFRVRMYGWRLFLANFLARRLRLKQWQKNVRLKMNEVEDRLVKGTTNQAPDRESGTTNSVPGIIED